MYYDDYTPDQITFLNDVTPKEWWYDDPIVVQAFGKLDYELEYQRFQLWQHQSGERFFYKYGGEFFQCEERKNSKLLTEDECNERCWAGWPEAFDSSQVYVRGIDHCIY